MNTTANDTSTMPRTDADGPITVGAIDHVNLSVANLERAMNFYESVFGFRLAEDGRSRRNAPYVILTAGGHAFLALHENPDAGPSSRPHINHWGFVVGDLDRVIEKLRARGVPIEDADDETGGVRHWAHSRSVYIRDPDSHEIELAEVFGGGLETGG